MGGKILVIDDEPLILTTVEKALGKVGYQVTTTSNPGEFVTTLASEGADLLIVDLHLGGIDTEALIAKAQGIAPRARLLIITGSMNSSKWEHSLEKPFKIEELRDKVRELLGGP
ncbi:MAG: response regulator [Nitrospirota bacterium]